MDAECRLSPEKRIDHARLIGYQRDNLTALKQRTTRRLIFSAFGDYSAKSGFGVSAQFSNFGITQNPVTKNIADTTLLEQVNQMFSLTPRYLLRTSEAVHFFQVSAFRQSLSNETSGTFAPAEIKTGGVACGVQLVAHGSPHFFFAIFQLCKNGNRNVHFAWPGRRVVLQGAGMFKNKGSVDANVSRIANRFGEDGTGAMLTAGLRFGIPIGESGLQYQLGGQFLRNTNDSGNVGLPTFTEFRVQSGFSWSFRK